MLWQVLAQGVRLAAIGGGLGILAAFGSLRVMRTMLFGVSPVDPLTLGGVAIPICVIAFARHLGSGAAGDAGRSGEGAS